MTLRWGEVKGDDMSMASTNKTPYYQLNQWVADDSVLRTDFNLDNSKIDQTLKNLTPVSGYYTGTGEASTQTVSLGFRPRILLIFPMGGQCLDGKKLPFGLSVEGFPSQNVTMTETGFQVSGSLNYPANESSNDSKERNPYRYVAWR